MSRIYYSLYDRLLSVKSLEAALRQVKSKKGAPGIDGQSIADFATGLDSNLHMLVSDLRDKLYRPLAVRRVELPKPDGGVRPLGIPAVVIRRSGKQRCSYASMDAVG